MMRVRNSHATAPARLNASGFPATEATAAVGAQQATQHDAAINRGYQSVVAVKLRSRIRIQSKKLQQKVFHPASWRKASDGSSQEVGVTEVHDVWEAAEAGQLSDWHVSHPSDAAAAAAAFASGAGAADASADALEVNSKTAIGVWHAADVENGVVGTAVDIGPVIDADVNAHSVGGGGGLSSRSSAERGVSQEPRKVRQLPLPLTLDSKLGTWGSLGHESEGMSGSISNSFRFARPSSSQGRLVSAGPRTSIVSPMRTAGAPKTAAHAIAPAALSGAAPAAAAAGGEGASSAKGLISRAPGEPIRVGDAWSAMLDESTGHRISRGIKEAGSAYCGDSGGNSPARLRQGHHRTGLHARLDLATPRGVVTGGENVFSSPLRVSSAATVVVLPKRLVPTKSDVAAATRFFRDGTEGSEAAADGWTSSMPHADKFERQFQSVPLLSTETSPAQVDWQGSAPAPRHPQQQQQQQQQPPQQALKGCLLQSQKQPLRPQEQWPPFPHHGAGAARAMSPRRHVPQHSGGTTGRASPSPSPLARDSEVRRGQSPLQHSHIAGDLSFVTWKKGAVTTSTVMTQRDMENTLSGQKNSRRMGEPSASECGLAASKHAPPSDHNQQLQQLQQQLQQKKDQEEQTERQRSRAEQNSQINSEVARAHAAVVHSTQQAAQQAGSAQRDVKPACPASAASAAVAATTAVHNRSHVETAQRPAGRPTASPSDAPHAHVGHMARQGEVHQPISISAEVSDRKKKEGDHKGATTKPVDQGDVLLASMAKRPNLSPALSRPAGLRERAAKAQSLIVVPSEERQKEAEGAAALAAGQIRSSSESQPAALDRVNRASRTALGKDGVQRRIAATRNSRAMFVRVRVPPRGTERSAATVSTALGHEEDSARAAAAATAAAIVAASAGLGVADADDLMRSLLSFEPEEGDTAAAVDGNCCNSQGSRNGVDGAEGQLRGTPSKAHAANASQVMRCRWANSSTAAGHGSALRRQKQKKRATKQGTTVPKSASRLRHVEPTIYEDEESGEWESEEEESGEWESEEEEKEPPMSPTRRPQGLGSTSDDVRERGAGGSGAPVASSKASPPLVACEGSHDTNTNSVNVVSGGGSALEFHSQGEFNVCNNFTSTEGQYDQMPPIHTSSRGGEPPLTNGDQRQREQQQVQEEQRSAGASRVPEPRVNKAYAWLGRRLAPRNWR